MTSAFKTWLWSWRPTSPYAAVPRRRFLGGGDEISTVRHLNGPEARNNLLLRDLPATPAVDSWTAHSPTP
ncbi:hypothetical protein [Streptomyces natalensis]|uniref:hypothetical protein n=1 Tax=Streptomyces natalensis TaxID=68242 RepID=UPI0005CAB081|nr:hypothetical protein [Streptomyces natalensis]